jgi:RHS repeat-associated protein
VVATVLVDPRGHPTTYQFSSAGELIAVTDALGHTTSYTRNATTNLVEAVTALTGGAAFTYDATGRRASRTVNGTATTYVYDGANPVKQATASSTTDLLTGLAIDEYLVRIDGSGTASFLADALSSTVALTDGSGSVQAEYSYEPYGAASVTGSPRGNESTFTARENDGTGVMYYRARYYHPTLQRFVSEDPIGFGGGDLNVYGYVRNSPLQGGDPLGLIGPAGGMLLGAFLGGTSGAQSSHPIIAAALGANMGLTVGVLIPIVPAGIPGAIVGAVSGAATGAAIGALEGKTNELVRGTVTGLIGGMVGGFVGGVPGAIAGTALTLTLGELLVPRDAGASNGGGGPLGRRK